MAEFFKVQTREQVLRHLEAFSPVGEERVPVEACLGRILSRSVTCNEDLPPFARSTMDGYAVRAQDTFGANESLPALLQVVGEVGMGEAPTLDLAPSQAVRISTGGMLPRGADAVVMLEYTQSLDDETLEAYKTVAPGEHVVQAGEDARAGEEFLIAGRLLRPQDIGILAAFGVSQVWVHKRPVVSIISTGDEVVPVESRPGPGQVRDVNSPALAALVLGEGGVPVRLGIVPDDRDVLESRCREGLEEADCLLLSGGSSVGVRDFALEVLKSMDGAEILAHGVAIKPGKPTLLANVRGKPLFGLPGHPVSALVIFNVLVKPLLGRLSGRKHLQTHRPIEARLSRNLASAQGREDYVPVILGEKENQLWAHPVLGASGLISILVRAEGLIRIDSNVEGLDRGARVEVVPLP